MKHDTYPKPRTLVTIWLVLMAATVGTMIAGKVTQVSSIGLIWMGVLMLVTWFKATLILNYFLDLKSASQGWGKVFGTLVALICISLYGLYGFGTLS